MACGVHGPWGGATTADGTSPLLIEVGNVRIEVEKRALSFPKTSGRFHGWLGYALARTVWTHVRFREQFPNESKYSYTFEEELDARESAAKIWGELSEEEHFVDAYFGDLQKVDRARFFREYVWYCVPHPPWKQPAGLRQEAFAKWLAAELPHHRVETWVTTIPGESGERVVLGVEPHRPTNCRIPIEARRPSNPALNPTGAAAPVG
jgi:hypothetical protein